MRSFAQIDLGAAPVPDETTVCKFRHLLERHKLGPAILRQVNAHLAKSGIKVNNGTIVGATILHAPSLTKSSSGARDPEMHQTKKGNEWHFGMKAHIGFHSKSRIVHTVVATPANVHDGRVLPDLLHGKETRIWGDAAYRGKTDVIRQKIRALPTSRSRERRARKTLLTGSAVLIGPNHACVLASSMSST